MELKAIEHTGQNNYDKRWDKMPDENQRPKGEYLIIKKPEDGFSKSFLEGLQRFQHGETAEESDQGLKQMMGDTLPEQRTTEDLEQSTNVLFGWYIATF